MCQRSAQPSSCRRRSSLFRSAVQHGDGCRRRLSIRQTRSPKQARGFWCLFLKKARPICDGAPRPRNPRFYSPSSAPRCPPDAPRTSPALFSPSFAHAIRASFPVLRPRHPRFYSLLFAPRDSPPPMILSPQHACPRRSDTPRNPPRVPRGTGQAPSRLHSYSTRRTAAAVSYHPPCRMYSKRPRRRSGTAVKTQNRVLPQRYCR